jgi:hypothetical protein
MAIVINSTTGEIDLDQTTPGTYVVTYTVQGVSSTQDVTVNAVDNAGFSYSASSYEPTDADPTPTITGLTGGTFSAGSGLVFVDSGTNTGSSTGEIDLSASTVASYTITYDTTSSGSSVCPNTSTQTVEIAAAGIANNYSMNFDAASSEYINAGNSTELQITGDITVSAWFKTSNSGSALTIAGRGAHYSSSLSSWALFRRSNNGLAVQLRVGNAFIYALSSSTTYNDGNWHHVCFTRETSSGDLKLYIDGSLSVTTTGVTGVMQNETKETWIGGSTDSYYFDGNIDEVAIWNTALTDGTGGTVNQIAEIYNATSTNLTKDLTTVSGSNLVYWNRMGD